MIAGRCLCGVVLEWVWQDSTAHLICLGLRWCGVCSEVAEYGEACRACRYRQTPAKRRRGKAWWRKQRELGTETYERDKARKRERYQTEPEYAARQKRTA